MNALFSLIAALLRFVFGFDRAADYMVRELANELTAAELAEERRVERENHARRMSAWWN